MGEKAKVLIKIKISAIKPKLKGKDKLAKVNNNKNDIIKGLNNTKPL